MSNSTATTSNLPSAEVMLELQDRINNPAKYLAQAQAVINAKPTISKPINIRDIMENVNGASFVGLTTTTIPPLLGGKANPMKGNVRKHVANSNVMVFTNQKQNGYDNMVKRRLDKEGKNPESFKLGSRQWGTRIKNTCFVEHKGALYIEVIFLKAGKVSFTYNSDIISRDDIQGLKAASNGEQGGLDDKVIIRTYKVASLDSVSIDGVVYTNIVE